MMMKRLLLILLILGLAGPLLAGDEATMRIVPLSLQYAEELGALGIFTMDNLLPGVPVIYKMAENTPGFDYRWVRENLCYPNTPVMQIEDAASYGGKILLGMRDNRAPQMRFYERAEAKWYKIGWSIGRWSVRRVDIYGSTPSSICDQWLGMGTAFLIERRYEGNSTVQVWVTAHHIPFLDQYILGARLRITHLLLDGKYDTIILPEREDKRFGVFLTGLTSLEMPVDWLPYDLFEGADDWKIGDKVLVPYYTMAYGCLPRNRREMYTCLQETMHVQVGSLNSAWPTTPSGIGADVWAQIDLMGGSSGSPWFLITEEDWDDPGHRNVRLLGVENVGFSSGQAGAQRFTQSDSLQIEDAVEQLQAPWREGDK